MLTLKYFLIRAVVSRTLPPHPQAAAASSRNPPRQPRARGATGQELRGGLRPTRPCPPRPARPPPSPQGPSRQEPCPQGDPLAGAPLLARLRLPTALPRGERPRRRGTGTAAARHARAETRLSRGRPRPATAAPPGSLVPSPKERARQQRRPPLDAPSRGPARPLLTFPPAEGHGPGRAGGPLRRAQPAPRSRQPRARPPSCSPPRLPVTGLEARHWRRRWQGRGRAAPPSLPPAPAGALPAGSGRGSAAA